MWGELLSAAFLGLSALSVSLRNVYQKSPIIESSIGPMQSALKSRTVKSTKREYTLIASLRIISLICFVLFVLISAAYLNTFGYFLVLTAAVYIIFFYLPGQTNSRLAVEIANNLAPSFIWLLNKTKKQTAGLEQWLRAREKAKTEAGHLSRSEILDLLQRQKAIYEGRSLGRDLHLAINLIELGPKKVEDIMMPLADVHLVGEQEAIGPILIDELHKSKRHIFPVTSKEDGIVGTVKLVDLINLPEGGKIKQIVDDTLSSVEVDDSIMKVLQQAPLNEKGMFIAQSNGKTKGIVYVEDVLNRIVTEETLN